MSSVTLWSKSQLMKYVDCSQDVYTIAFGKVLNLYSNICIQAIAKHGIEWLHCNNNNNNNNNDVNNNRTSNKLNLLNALIVCYMITLRRAVY